MSVSLVGAQHANSAYLRDIFQHCCAIAVMDEVAPVLPLIWRMEISLGTFLICATAAAALIWGAVVLQSRLARRRDTIGRHDKEIRELRRIVKRLSAHVRRPRRAPRRR